MAIPRTWGFARPLRLRRYFKVMSSSRFAILDPAAGISGDMLLGALIDAGAPPEWLRGLPSRLGFPQVEVDIDQTLRCGISCIKVSIRPPGGVSEQPSAGYIAPHPHGPNEPHHHHEREHHDHGGNPHHSHPPDPAANHHLPELVARLESAALSSWVRERAIRAFRLLCEEEGRVHGVPAEAVALHEVGAADALIDIVGGIEGFERLGIERVFVRPVALGSGWVRAAHGVIPVPAPVTTRLLEGLEIGPDGPVVGEATTPTGAVLLRVLTSGPPPSRWRATRTAWGAGGRNPENYPNAVRILIAEMVTEAAQIVTLSSDLDDLSPEYLEPLREALVAAGALDVQVWTTQMKKSRPGFRIEAVCGLSESDRVTEAFFLHSTTAGVRRALAERVTLPRRQIQVPIAGSVVSVKILETPTGPRVKAEFDDVRRAALQLGRPALEVAREVETTARRMVTGTVAKGSRSPKEQG
jgi:pyridinium-3,5-bisthiocarboxylic acid mononucleotide nickel chelatase